MKIMNRLATLTVLAGALVSSAFGACLDEAQVAGLVAAVSGKPADLPEGLSEADGACSRAKLHALMTKQGAKVIGYKAGLTNPAVQKRFNYDKPVWGRLYQDMLLKSGSSVDAAFGARPLFEADLLVRVRSDDINAAGSPAEVLDAVDQIIPFIELPDLAVKDLSRVNGPALSAINVAAKLGVLGEPIAVPESEAARAKLLAGLRDMAVTLTDGGGKELSKGRGADVLDHPLNAVIWLAKALKAEGGALEPGQLISVGSFSPLLPPKAGLQVTATYDGLPGAAPVTVTFK